MKRKMNQLGHTTEMGLIEEEVKETNAIFRGGEHGNRMVEIEGPEISIDEFLGIKPAKTTEGAEKVGEEEKKEERKEDFTPINFI